MQAVKRIHQGMGKRATCYLVGWRWTEQIYCKIMSYYVIMQMYVQEEDYEILRISASSTMVVYVSEVYSSRNGKECDLLPCWREMERTVTSEK